MDAGWQQKLEPEIQDMLRKVADMVLSDARDEVPVRTGALRDSLISEVSEMEARVGSRDIDYAEDVELGTADQSPQPYLKPSLYQQRTVS